METKNRSNLKAGEIAALAARVEELLRLCERLQDENARLRAKQSQLLMEKSHLAEKAGVSKHRIEGIVARLKAMEVEL